MLNIMPTKLCLPSTKNRSKGTILGKIHGEKLQKRVQSLAPKRVTALKKISLPDVMRGKTAERKLNVSSVGLNMAPL